MKEPYYSNEILDQYKIKYPETKPTDEGVLELFRIADLLTKDVIGISYTLNSIISKLEKLK